MNKLENIFLTILCPLSVAFAIWMIISHLKAAKNNNIALWQVRKKHFSVIEVNKMNKFGYLLLFFVVIFISISLFDK